MRLLDAPGILPGAVATRGWLAEGRRGSFSLHLSLDKPRREDGVAKGAVEHRSMVLVAVIWGVRIVILSSRSSAWAERASDTV